MPVIRKYIFRSAGYEEMSKVPALLRAQGVKWKRKF